MIEQTNMLQRMRELAVQAATGTLSNVQRGYLDLEYQALATQINKITNETKWNDQSLLTGTGGTLSGTFTYQVGQSSGNTIAVTISSMSITSLGLSALGIVDVSGSTGTIASVGAALEKINVQRAALGAAINQLAYAADNVTNIASNTTQSRSTIMDTDYALATTQLAKAQIIQQAATAMLAQANQQPQGVMALLKG